MLKVGQAVEWASQARGTSRIKKGVIVAIVPSHQHPHVANCIPEGCKLMPGAGKFARHQVSYLVQVGKSTTLFWPKTPYLKEATCRSPKR